MLEEIRKNYRFFDNGSSDIDMEMTLDLATLLHNAVKNFSINNPKNGTHICYVTEEPISLSECNDCETVSCPINTGYANEPKRIDEDI